MASPLPVLLLTLSLSSLSAAYSWNFATPPQQCSNVTISLVGSGIPPYRVLLMPFGPSPLMNGVEVRTAFEMAFPDNSKTVSFTLKYPAHSQLVAVVSDSTGFGSGGTSAAAQVATSSDTSCFNASLTASYPFYFSIQPTNQLVQCQDTRIWWDDSNNTIEGTPNFLGVIPGGQSFSIPESNITTVASEGTGFTWEPSILAGTTLILVGGDNRGNGTGGSVTYQVSAGTTPDSSCLSNLSPSSTPGNPAGGTYPTGTGASSTGGSSGGTHIGAIVGGIVGVIAFIVACVLIFWALCRRRNSQRRTTKLPKDIIDMDDDDDAPRAMGQNELPQHYQPEPFMVPIPGPTFSEFGDEVERPLLSGTGTTSSYTRSDTPDLASTLNGLGAGPVIGGGSSGAGRKGGVPKPMRAVNIIQHEDAGPSNSGDMEEPVETIELPPAYTMVRTSGGDSGSGGPSTSVGR